MTFIITADTLLITACAASMMMLLIFAISNTTMKIRPAGLRRGDTIALVAPAGALDRDMMDRARQRLENMGFTIKAGDDLCRRRGYLAGDDARRAQEFNDAFADHDVKAVFPGTGGYGSTRILDRIDYDLIRANPKILIGFSDITALHLAVGLHSGLVTFHCPNPMHALGSEKNLTDFSAKYFWRNILAEHNTAEPGFAYDSPPEGEPIHTIRSGVARGPLIGGTLAITNALMGTPYEMDTRDAVLFLEDVRERPYRVDRLLCQLRLAGKLDTCAAVILGQFTKCIPDAGEVSLGINEVFEDYFHDAPYPVVGNFPAGHHRYNATLPMGAIVEVDADRAVVRVLENPVTA